MYEHCGRLGRSGKTAGALSREICRPKLQFSPRRRLDNPPSWTDNLSLTTLQQSLVNTGGRLIMYARYYWRLLAESDLTRRFFGALVWWNERFPEIGAGRGGGAYNDPVRQGKVGILDMCCHTLCGHTKQGGS